MKTPETMTKGVQTRGDFRRLAESTPPESGPDNPRAAIPSEHPIWELWETLTEFFGSAFVSQYGDTPPLTWIACLDGLSAADIGTGALKLKEWESSFPPTPAQFRAMCEGKRNAIEAQQERQARGSAPALPPPYLSPDQARPYLAAIRATLDGGKPNPAGAPASDQEGPGCL